MNTPIKTYTQEGLAELTSQLGQPPFRCKQLVKWLYQQGVSSYDQMSNLPKTMREHLASSHPLYSPLMVDKQVSDDGTRKYLLEYHDGARVEAVAIPSSPDIEGESKRLTVCVSTQVGCAMGCVFCATGNAGYKRNLEPGEIVDQVLAAQSDMGHRVSNVVVMGQGEPFLNFDNTIAALRFVNSPEGLEVGARHIAISTCGIVPGIERLSQEPEQFTLAISLHATQQDVRDALMPKMAQYPLVELKKSLVDYTKTTGRRVTLEYIMIDGINDSSKALHSLERFCANLLCHVNLLPINLIEGNPLSPSSKKTINIWRTRLNQAHIETTIRNSRGSDIAGACGQLKGSNRTS